MPPSSWTSETPEQNANWQQFNNFAFYTYDSLGASYDDPSVQYDLAEQVISDSPLSAWTPSQDAPSTWTQVD